MNHCPITYEACGDSRYSKEGLKRLSRNLTHLNDLPLTAEEQVKEAAARADKMSIQGVQPKLSAVLSPKKGGFEIVDRGGRYILKPQIPGYFQVPENEDLTMRLAESIGIEVPLHGLVYSKDRSMTYFIRRFDRMGHGEKWQSKTLPSFPDKTGRQSTDHPWSRWLRSSIGSAPSP